MCGVAGLIRLGETRICADRLALLSKRLQHRGPDDHGFAAWSPGAKVIFSRDAGIAANQSVGLATRRLSILDLSSAGAQPMGTADGRYWLAYNGEVYNYVELREELLRSGHRFRSGSDTEVVLEALVAWGRFALLRFSGMFALAFLDVENQTLLLARDHFGIKPLYFVRNPSELTFSSEISPLIGFVPSPAANSSRAFDYLRFGRCDESNETMIAGIENLRAGHTLTVSVANREIGSQEPFWQLKVPPEAQLSFDEAAKIARDKFLRNIEIHLRSDVPVGACLSGGIDSSACVAAMRHVKGNSLDVHTFTYSSGSALDERPWASLVAGATSSKWHVTSGSADDLRLSIDNLIQVQGEPFATTSIYAQQLVFRLVAATGIKVVLDGQGADEMLGGYAVFLAARIASSLRQGNLVEAARLVRAARTKGGFRQAPLIAARYLLPHKAQRALRHLVGRELMPRWANRMLFDSANADFHVSVGVNEDLLHAELRESLTRTLLGLLRYEDRNSMAVSVESRLPFLTVDLAEFFLALPTSYLISSDATTKAIFRRAMRGIVPDAILQRRDKISFQTPESMWMTQLDQWATPILRSETARTCPFVDYSVASDIWTKAQRDPRNYDTWLWRWLNLVRWAQIHAISWPEGPAMQAGLSRKQ